MSGDAVNADLARERERASVDVDALSTVLAGGAAAQRQHHKIRSIVENDPHLGNAADIFMTRTERHVRRCARRAHRIFRRGGGRRHACSCRPPHSPLPFTAQSRQGGASEGAALVPRVD